MTCAIARAPSNIALVKYMGKADAASNLPENPSLSLTLSELCTFAEVKWSEGAAEATWIEGAPGGGRLRLFTQGMDERLAAGLSRALDLPEAARDRMLGHVTRAREALIDLLRERGVGARAGGRLELRATNSFPEAAGIASSASSFAAVTLALAAAVSERRDRLSDALRDPAFRAALSEISRSGSGSSCRSFDGPWVRWERDRGEVSPSSLGPQAVFVLVFSEERKDVGSSEAHRRVRTSPLWAGRPGRATARAEEAARALQRADSFALARLSWVEAWEMHSLFHTSDPPFTYWSEGTLRALRRLAPWVAGEAPPIVTLDAGSNVHVIVDAEERGIWRERLNEAFPGQAILEDRQGPGAELVEG